jgi:nitrogen-specific signal transduction histidine kinase
MFCICLNSFNVINNFIRNSIQHGFDENTKEKHLVFNVSKDETTSEVVIDMLDNGKGFSNDFSFNDYITFGIKSNSKGSGIGGYLLYRTIEIHDGIIECIEKGKLVYIPSQKNYPFIEKHERSENIKIGIKSGVHFRIVLPAKTN